jgi:hypothetical protein
VRLRSAALVLFLVLSLSAPIAAAQGGDLSLSSVTATGVERRLTAEAYAEGPAGLLAAAAGVESFPVACGTPLMLPVDRGASAGSEAWRQAIAALAAPPPLPDDRIVITRDGRFSVRYPASAPLWGRRDLDGPPEAVQKVLEALAASRAWLVDTLGYPDPAPGSATITVALVPLGRGLEGFILPARTTPQSTPPAIVLDVALPEDRLMPAALHQVAHLSLLQAARSEAWWHEATAAWLTLLATGDLEAQRDSLQSRLDRPTVGLSSDGLRMMQGALLWPLFLAERTGDPSVVRQVWDELASGATDPLQAADTVLRRQGLSLASALREKGIWDLFTGDRDDGAHYSLARAMPLASLESVGRTLPLLLGPVGPIEPTGSIAFRIPAERARGTVDLSLAAEGGRPAADLLIFQERAGPPLLVPVPMEEGRGRVSVPWSEAKEAWIVLRNEAAAREAGASRFDVQAVNDPFSPFDLAGFTAEAVGRSVVLQWTTAAEKGLVAWNVYRAERPDGPFSRLNNVAVPAYGDGDADTGYVFVDDGARPDRRYYYQVEGITSAGLVERSHLASVRTPAR